MGVNRSAATEPADETQPADENGVRPGDSEPHGGIRGLLDRIRSTPAGRLTLKIVVGVIGAALVVGGLIMVPFPGPGWLVVFAGLALLATEFEWAHRLLGFAKEKVTSVTRWLKRRHWSVQLLAGLLTALLAAAIVWLGLKLTFHIDLVAEVRARFFS